MNLTKRLSVATMVALAVAFLLPLVAIACGKGGPSPSSTSVPTQANVTPPLTSVPVQQVTEFDFSRYLPFTAELTLSHAPALHEPATLTFTFGIKPDRPQDFDNVDAWVDFPLGAVWLGGDPLRWRGDLVRGKEVTLTATVAFVKEGNWRFKGTVHKPLGVDRVNGPVVDLDLNVDATSGKFGLVRPTHVVGSRPPSDIPLTPADPALQDVWSTANFLLWIPSKGIRDYGWQVPPQIADSPSFLVVHDQDEWNALKAQGYFSNPPIGRLQYIDILLERPATASDLGFDFQSQFLIVAFDKTRDTTGYRFRIQGVSGRSGVMQVLVESVAPQEGMPVEPIPNRPYSAVAVARQYALEDAHTEMVFVVNGEEKSRKSLVLRAEP